MTLENSFSYEEWHIAVVDVDDAAGYLTVDVDYLYLLLVAVAAAAAAAAVVGKNEYHHYHNFVAVPMLRHVNISS
jgi:hypothetical protein